MHLPHLELARRLAVGTTVLALGAVVLLPATSYAATAHRPWPGHPGRHLVDHVVRRGETPSGLAVRYHAWTRELISLNRIHHGAIYVGETLRIPVVDPGLRAHPTRPRHRHHPKATPAPPRHAPASTSPASRVQARRAITGTARRYGVPVSLALALAWQESGWQQRAVSSAGAIGVMQVLPGTGAWMSLYAGRPLRLHRLDDNVLAGVLLLKLLRAETTTNRRAIAAYYQGLGSVHRHDILKISKPYVANVLALRRALLHGWRPV